MANNWYKFNNQIDIILQQAVAEIRPQAGDEIPQQVVEEFNQRHRRISHE